MKAAQWLYAPQRPVRVAIVLIALAIPVVFVNPKIADVLDPYVCIVLGAILWTIPLTYPLMKGRRK